MLKRLHCRLRIPSYVARVVCGGAVHCDPHTLHWFRQMPLLNLMAKGLYFQMQNEERYKRYNDLPGTIHGVKPPQGKDLYDLQDKAAAMPFDYRWEYDAESIFWTMYGALLRVTPVEFTEPPDDTTVTALGEIWKVFQGHAIPGKPKIVDTRNALLSDRQTLRSAFPPVMEPVADLLLRIVPHVLPPYPSMDQLPPYDDHFHEAMQRLILEYLVDNRREPIPLEPQVLRKANYPGVRIGDCGTDRSLHPAGSFSAARSSSGLRARQIYRQKLTYHLIAGFCTTTSSISKLAGMPCPPPRCHPLRCRPPVAGRLTQQAASQLGLRRGWFIYHADPRCPHLVEISDC
ncbi:hypothetical protein C8Q70DRAFT_267786 [Cubamyces menziesii]|nr:hypothetical protein C8Q70DRAFT_267786 [Cubamyces menziesii]